MLKRKQNRLPFVMSPLLMTETRVKPLPQHHWVMQWVWFDFGVYGFVAYALGKVFFPGLTPACRWLLHLPLSPFPF